MSKTERVQEKRYKPVSIKSVCGRNGKEQTFVLYDSGLIVSLCGEVLMKPFLHPDRSVNYGESMLGFSFHLNYQVNGLFYINYVINANNCPPPYSEVNPAIPSTLCQTWINECAYSAYNITEEWSNRCGQIKKERVLLKIRNPFFGHEGTDTLSWCREEEIDTLVLVTSDGGASNDPFRLAQDDDRPHGKVLSIDVETEVEWPDPKSIAYMSQLNKQQKMTIKILSKGIRSPGTISSYCDHTYVCDRGLTFGKVYEGIKDKNYGWRAWDYKFITTSRLPDKNQTKICVIEEEEKEVCVDWTASCYPKTPKKVYIAPGECVTIKTTDKTKTDLVSCDKDWNALLDQKISQPPSDGICKKIKFRCEGEYYFKSNFHQNVRLIIIVSDDTHQFKSNKSKMIELRNERAKCSQSSYNYLVMFRQEALEYGPGETPIEYTLSDSPKNGYSQGSIITGFQQKGRNRFLTTLSIEDCNANIINQGYIEMNGEKLNLCVKGCYTALGQDRLSVYLGTYNGCTGKVYRLINCF